MVIFYSYVKLPEGTFGTCVWKSNSPVSGKLDDVIQTATAVQRSQFRRTALAVAHRNGLVAANGSLASRSVCETSPSLKSPSPQHVAGRFDESAPNVRAQ